jgi:uncharacterized protein with GYD domain
MANYVLLTNWTDQGARAAKDTVKRVAAARQSWEKLGVRIKEFYWTMGKHDCVVICEAPNDEAITAACVQLGALGNARTNTLRAFNESEMEQILKKVG